MRWKVKKDKKKKKYIGGNELFQVENKLKRKRGYKFFFLVRVDVVFIFNKVLL